MNRRHLLTLVLLVPYFVNGNPQIRIEAAVEKCRVRGRVSGTRGGISLLLYAKTDVYYIQPCITEPRHRLRVDGTFGPIDTHAGRIYAIVVRAGFRSAEVLNRLPAIDGTDVLAVAGPFGTAEAACDVPRCPAL